MRSRVKFGAQLLAVVSVLVFVPAMLVSAHQSPGSCNSSNLNLTITKNRTVVREGDTITYTVNARNQDSGSNVACDITNADVTLTLPATDGTPTGQQITLATNADYPAGTPLTVIGSADYTVDVNDGVVDIVAQAEVNGTLHDAPVDHSAQITKTIGTSLTEPRLRLAKAVNPVNAKAKQTVTYTYVLTNDSTTNAVMSDVVLDDDNCSPMRLTSGDTNANGVLDVSEAWTYTCKRTFDVAGTYTNTAQATAINSEDGLPVSSGPATAVVTVVGVLPGLPKTGSQ